MGHSTEECITLRDKIEELIRAGHLKKYIKSERAQPVVHRERSPHRNPARERSGYDDRYYRAPPRPERHDRPSPMRRDRSHSRSRNKPDNDRPVRGVINTISGGFSGEGLLHRPRTATFAPFDRSTMYRSADPCPQSHSRMMISMRLIRIRMTGWSSQQK